MSALKITDHWLDIAIHKPIPGGNEMNVRRFLVEHFTAGWSALSSIEFWKSPEANGASAHLVIDRDGTVYQCRPFNRTCGHAGASQWKDPNTGKTYTGLNSCSIGIELANSGDMGREFFPSSVPLYGGQRIERVEARHRNGGPLVKWEVYPEPQITACKEVSKLLCEHYNLDDLVGHDQIAPNRKVDPGPAFPMREVRAFCGFQS